MKPWYRSKTIRANAAAIALAYWFDASEFYVNPLLFVCVVAGLNLVLRTVTTEQIRWR